MYQNLIDLNQNISSQLNISHTFRVMFLNKLRLSCAKLRASLNLSGFDEIIVYID